MAARSRYLASIKEDPPPPPPPPGSMSAGPSAGPSVGSGAGSGSGRPSSSHSYRSHHSYGRNEGTISSNSNPYPNTKEEYGGVNLHNTHNTSLHDTSMDESVLSALSNPPPPPPGPPPSSLQHGRIVVDGRGIDRIDGRRGGGTGGAGGAGGFSEEYSYGDNFSIPTANHENVANVVDGMDGMDNMDAVNVMGGVDLEESLEMDHIPNMDILDQSLDHSLDRIMDGEDDDHDNHHGEEDDVHNVLGHHLNGGVLSASMEMEQFDPKAIVSYGTGTTSFDSIHTKERNRPTSSHGNTATPATTTAVSASVYTSMAGGGDRPSSRGKKGVEESSMASNVTPKYQNVGRSPSSRQHNNNNNHGNRGNVNDSGSGNGRPTSSSMRYSNSNSDVISHDGSKESVASRRRRKAQQNALGYDHPSPSSSSHPNNNNNTTNNSNVNNSNANNNNNHTFSNGAAAPDSRSLESIHSKSYTRERRVQDEQDQSNREETEHSPSSTTNNNTNNNNNNNHTRQRPHRQTLQTETSEITPSETEQNPPLVLYDSDDVVSDDENSAMTGKTGGSKKKKALDRVKNLIRIGNKLQKRSPSKSPIRGRHNQTSDSNKKRSHSRSKSPSTRRKFFSSSSSSDHHNSSTTNNPYGGGSAGAGGGGGNNDTVKRSAEIKVNRAKLADSANKINASLHQLRESESKGGGSGIGAGTGTGAGADGGVEKSVGSNSYGKRPGSGLKSHRSDVHVGTIERDHGERPYSASYNNNNSNKQQQQQRPSATVSMTSGAEDEDHPDDVSEMTNPTYAETGATPTNSTPKELIHSITNRDSTTGHNAATISGGGGGKTRERAITSESESSMDQSESATPLVTGTGTGTGGGHGTTTAATTTAAPSSRGLNALHETTRDVHGFPTTKSTSIKDDGFGSASVDAWSTSQKDEFFPSNTDFTSVTADSMSGKETKDPFDDPFFPDANVNTTATATATIQQQQQQQQQSDTKSVTRSTTGMNIRRQFSESTYASDPPLSLSQPVNLDMAMSYSTKRSSASTSTPSAESLDMQKIEKDDTISFDEEEKLAASDANIMVLQHHRDHPEYEHEHEEEDGVRHTLPSSPVKSIESMEEEEEEETDPDLMVPSGPETSEHFVGNDIEEEEQVNPVGSQRPMSSYSRGRMKYQRSEKPYNDIPDEYQRPKEDSSAYHHQQRPSTAVRGGVSGYDSNPRDQRPSSSYHNTSRDDRSDHVQKNEYSSSSSVYSTGNKSIKSVKSTKSNSSSNSNREKYQPTTSSQFAERVTKPAASQEIFRNSGRTTPTLNTNTAPFNSKSPSPASTEKEIIPALSPRGMRRILQPGNSHSPKYHDRHNLTISHPPEGPEDVPTVNRVTQFNPYATNTKQGQAKSNYSRNASRAASLLEARKSPARRPTNGAAPPPRSNNRYNRSPPRSSNALVKSKQQVDSKREQFRQPSFQRRPQTADTDTIASEITDPIQRAGFRILTAAAIPIQNEIRRYLAMKAADEKRWAIVVIQAYFRRWRCELYRYRLLYCATRIQAAFRGWLLRDTLADEHYCATQIQKIARGYLATMQVYESLYNITVVQSIVRRNAAIREATRRRNAIIAIQSAWRGFVVRQCIAFEDYQATRIQSLWRGYSAQLSYQFDIVDIIIVQSIVRRRAAQRLRAAKIHRHMTEAAIVIQKYWRSYDCTINYLHTIADVLIVQSVARRWIAKRYVESYRYDMQYTASTKIQKIVRGWTARIRWKRFMAAVNIQRTWRGFQCYIDYIFAVADIVIAQRVVRQFLAKKKVEAMRLKNASDRVHNAAVMIQKSWRGYQAHMDMLFNLVHIIIAQSVIRRRLAIKKVKPRLIEYRAAKTIQKGWYMYTSEKNYFRFVAAKKIQAFRRGIVARREYRRLRAARLIQSHIRGYFASRALKEYYAARKIQAWSRCRTTRRGYNYYTNARKIQAVWRGFAGRRELDEEVWVRNYAATLIQKMWRGFYQFSSYTIVHFENKAAVTIQSSWRGFWQYSHYVIMSYEITRIQALVRGHQQRQNLALQNLAATKIQAIVRAFMTKKYIQMERLLEAMLHSAQISLSSRIAATKIQRFWRIQMIYRRQKRAALVIERFFVWVRNEVEREIERREELKAKKRDRQRRQKKTEDDNLLESVWNNALDGAGANITPPAPSGRKKERPSSRARAAKGAEIKQKRSKSRPKKIPSTRVQEEKPVEKKRKERFSYYTPETSSNRPTDAIPIDNTDVNSEVSGITTPSILHSPLAHRSSGGRRPSRPKIKEDPLDDVDESLEAAWAESTKGKRPSRKRSSSKKPIRSSMKENSSTNVRVKQRRDVLNRP